MADEMLQYVALMANYVSRIKSYPYLDAVNCVKMCLLFREGDRGNLFSKKHVFGSWCLSMLLCFSGSVVSNFLAGEPIITPFKYQENLIIATAIWYILNYSPNDLMYKLFKIPMVEILLTCLWDIYLVIKIQSGVSYGIKHFTDAYAIATVLGMAKGSGHTLVNAMVKMVKGSFVETDNEFLHLSTLSKCSFVSSLLFILSHFYQLAGYHQSFVFMACLLLFTHVSISMQAFGTSGIFAPLEYFACRVLFGCGQSATEDAEEYRDTSMASNNTKDHKEDDVHQVNGEEH